MQLCIAPTLESSLPTTCGKRLTAPAVQAVEAEEKEDREIICSEVFSDITCELDAHAKGGAGVQLGMPCTPHWAQWHLLARQQQHTCRAGELDAQDARLYFEVLAPYFWRVRPAVDERSVQSNFMKSCHAGEPPPPCLMPNVPVQTEARPGRGAAVRVPAAVGAAARGAHLRDAAVSVAAAAPGRGRRRAAPQAPQGHGLRCAGTLARNTRCKQPECTACAITASGHVPHGYADIGPAPVSHLCCAPVQACGR